jgi:hypothetical protein
MPRPSKTKLERAISMIERGATTAAIIKSLNVSPQYVYNIRSRLRKKTPPKEVVTIISPTREQEQARAMLNTAMHPPEIHQSIQGEYSKYQQMTTWQRIKAAIGF